MHLNLKYPPEKVLYIDVRIYSVNRQNCQARNVSLCNDNTKLPKPRDTQFRDAFGLESRGECYWGYVSVFDNTPEKLILKSIFHLKVAATLLSGSRKGT